MQMNEKTLYWLIAAFILVSVTLVYSNHFTNAFHFDDSHTITQNIYIRDIRNIPLMFINNKTFGTMPNNRGYRPIVTASTALDYWIGGGLKPFFFHLSMFLLFIAQGVLLFFLYGKIFEASLKNPWNRYLALFAVGLYLLHPGCAETINYIIARSDSFSTFFVVMALVLYIYSQKARRYYLYLIAVLLGLLSKETAAAFPLFLFSYIWLFEKKRSMPDLFRKVHRTELWGAVKETLPSFLFCLGLALLIQYINYSQTTSGFFQFQEDTFSNRLKYNLIQPYVMLTYVTTFFFPIALSSDSDMTVLQSFLDGRFYLGLAFLALLFYAIIFTSRNERHRPIAFGLLWFFLALIPTSFLAHLTQVANSHRLFYPYVGLTISIGWAAFLFILKIRAVFNDSTFKKAILLSALSLFIGFGYLTHQRNKVWKTEESLWKDITEKSPNNSRGLMNYGLAFMGKGKYFEAEYYFKKALRLWPRWSYIHINMGVLKNAINQPQEAEIYFKNALLYGQRSTPVAYYHYAKFLDSRNRPQEAIPLLSKAIAMSDGHVESRELLMTIYLEKREWQKLSALARQVLNMVPNDPKALKFLDRAKNRKTLQADKEEEVKKNPTPEAYLNLSLYYYQRGLYHKAIAAAQEALRLRPRYELAYNNICSAYNGLKEWDKAIEACQKALLINPNYRLAKNNLNLAKKQKASVVKEK